MRRSFYAGHTKRSTFTWALVVALSGSAWAAEPPKFQEGGFTMTLQYGYGVWGLDRQRLSRQVDGQDPGGSSIFIGDAQNGHTASLRLAYNILGHASLGAELTATGWNLFDVTRGGAGFAVGTVTWHPLQLVWWNQPKRPIPLDFGTFFGVGYGLGGQRRGMDGLVFEWGASIDWYFSRFFGLGAFVRGVFLDLNSFYLDFQNRAQPGNTIALPERSGGSFWTFGVSVIVRAGD